MSSSLSGWRYMLTCLTISSPLGWSALFTICLFVVSCMFRCNVHNRGGLHLVSYPFIVRSSILLISSFNIIYTTRSHVRFFFFFQRCCLHLGSRLHRYVMIFGSPPNPPVQCQRTYGFKMFGRTALAPGAGDPSTT